MVPVGHHKAARQNANAAFKDAHVDVQKKRLYTLAFKECLRESNGRRVIGLQQQFHAWSVIARRWNVEAADASDWDWNELGRQSP